MKEKLINLKNKIISGFISLKNKLISNFIDLKNKTIPFIKTYKAISIIALIALVVVMALLIIIFDKKEIGNTSGNLNNLGFSVDKGGWVYYLGYNQGVSDGIYRVKRK